RVLLRESADAARALGMIGLLQMIGPVADAGAGGVARDPAVHAGPPRMDREGELWRVEHGGKTARVKDSRGMRLLARLVERPGEEIHVLVLASEEATSLPESSA